MGTLAANELKEFIQGDLTKLEKVSLITHQKLEKIYKEIAPVVVTIAYVRRVLERFRDGMIEEREVQE